MLVMENHGMESVRLEKGQLLGEVVPVTEVSEPELEPSDSAVPPADEEEGAVYTLSGLEEGRGARLLGQLGMKVDHLTPEQQLELTELVASYSDVFALDPSELGTTDATTHIIDTGDHRPIRQPVRRTPFALRSKVDELVKEMLEQGVVVPSKSPWASPVVLVRKKDGGVRFCVDYRKLNQVTKLDEYPLPRIDDTLDQLAGTKYFTTLDLASGYWQVEMDPASQEKTAFTTYAGLFEFRKMPFGLVNAPATFQRMC